MYNNNSINLTFIFEILSVKSDVEFWRNNTNLTGLSTRSICIELFSQVIVLLFLIDSDTSVLVTIPAFVSICIQVGY